MVAPSGAARHAAGRQAIQKGPSVRATIGQPTDAGTGPEALDGIVILPSHKKKASTGRVAGPPP
jgi:hypothetical protein